MEFIFSKYYLSLRTREKYSAQMHSQPDISCFKEKIAIVMQGPIIEKNQFTLETLKIYRKRFPEVMLILSTWDHYSYEVFYEYNKIGVEVIKNKKPEYYGISNINLQIKSARQGVLRAKELGADYCLKTRTDQRIYQHDFLMFFLSLLKTFPIDQKLKPNARIVSVSLNTYKYRLYGVTDMLNFGNVEDLVNFWDIDYDFRTLKDMNLGPTVLDWGKARLCEIYLATEYLKKMGHIPVYTIKDSWQCIADYFIIIDRESINLFWLKYNRWNENRRSTEIARSLAEEFRFADWINAYHNMSLYKMETEHILNKINMSQ